MYLEYTMRFLLLALAFVSTPAFSAPCSIPGLPDIKGKSYHVARGMLIDAGFRPVAYMMPKGFTPVEDYWKLGYIEVRDVGNQVTLYGWRSPKNKDFTMFETHLGKIGIEQCGLAPGIE